MKQINEPHIFKGMQRDLSISKYDVNFLYDAHNIRLTAREEDTLLSITNERGPNQIKDKDGKNIEIKGTYLGHCLLNKYLVIFSTDAINERDYITRIDLSTNTVKALYNSFEYISHKSLGFSVDHKIEAIASYENEKIQKVYWTDGKNQPRFINISPENDNKIASYTANSFEFVQELYLKDNVIVTPLYGSGEFPSGMIQYAFTYINKFGQESNIFNTSKLQCIAFHDRGGSPEEKISISFRIEVSNCDPKVEYVRIYSILRTSIDATPVVKRLQDIQFKGSPYRIVFTDNGTIGEDVDPTELLYKGGETITAKTIEQKDGTLFLGNIHIERHDVEDIKESLNTIFEPTNNNALTPMVSTDNYLKSTLKAVNGVVLSRDIPYLRNADNSGFKSDEIYRIGVHFQYKTGKWSEPIWLRDTQITTKPYIDSQTPNLIHIPQVELMITDADILKKLSDSEYKRARLLMAMPSYNDRTILCQGIANSTLYTNQDRYIIENDAHTITDPIGHLYGQSSWIFRPKSSFSGIDTEVDGGGYIATSGSVHNITSMEGEVSGDNKLHASPKLWSTEIGGNLGENGEYRIDPNLFTLHSPELIFSDDLYSTDWNGKSIYKIGAVGFTKTLGDIDIQTSTPTIGSASGFIQKSARTRGDAALISGPFYEDYIVEDVATSPVSYQSWDEMYVPVKWPIYLWHKTGSLNNDVIRENSSAKLLKKKTSNYHIGNTIRYDTEIAHLQSWNNNELGIGLFQSNELTIVKLRRDQEDREEVVYMGNIDTSATPTKTTPKYFLGYPFRRTEDEEYTWSKTMYGTKYTVPNYPSYYKLFSRDAESGTVTAPGGVIVLKSTEDTPLSWEYEGGTWGHVGGEIPDLSKTSEPIRIKYKSTPHLVSHYREDIFAMCNDLELPLLEVRTSYNPDTFYGGKSQDAIKSNMWIPISDPKPIDYKDGFTIVSDRGDTYFQRFECLKTYAFTPEDINQVIDIASFVCESHINMDGRYDRNRGQLNNLNMSPTNFNLINPIYSQLDNFFNYRVLDSDYYKISDFPNQITWTKEKQAGADVDLWTNITLASTYDMDGSKGEITSLNTWKDQIYCFQDKGISNILFNSRVQIPTSDGIPIEITNSYKVDGYRYLSDGVGCSEASKWTIKETPAGIYFIDSISNDLYHIGESLSDISTSHNMTTWFKHNTIDRTLYDDVNHDLYLVTDTEALCYSEILGQFTSFMSYDNLNLMESYNKSVFSVREKYFYEMFKGDYNTFFGKYKGWNITMLSNGKDQATIGIDKTFSNIEYRMDLKYEDYLHDSSFDYIRVYNEYQDTEVQPLGFLKDKPSNLKKKFRIWHIDIPRNLKKDDLGKGNRDRIRNPWCKIKLGMWEETDVPYIPEQKKKAKAELHDIMVQYWI